MKTAQRRTAQWVGAVLILAAMVFVLTFAMNYLGGGKKAKPTVIADTPRLTFATPVFPPVSMPPVVAEHRKASFHDFWFENREDKEVKVGLLGTTSNPRVEAALYRVPPDDVPRLVACAAGQWVAAGTGSPFVPWGLSGLALAQEARATRTLGGKVEGLPLHEEGWPVPPRSVGWLRLHWANDRMGDLQLGALLWTDQKQNEVVTQVEARVRSLPPLLALPDSDVGSMDSKKAGELFKKILDGDLEIPVPSTDVGSLPRTLVFYCGSATQPELAVEAEVRHDGRPAKSDPLVVTGPERLTDAERRRLEDKLRLFHLLCAYRFTVTLRAVSEDGTARFEEGRFQRYLTLTCVGQDVRQQVMLQGVIQGDVQVGSRTEAGVVPMGSFPASQGREYTMVLQSDVPGLELEVDAARTAEFLKVVLDKPETAPSGHRTWRLRVKVPPNTVYGKFPSADDPLLRDSAVYLRRKGGTPRSIRIPVGGTAISD